MWPFKKKKTEPKPEIKDLKQPIKLRFAQEAFLHLAKVAKHAQPGDVIQINRAGEAPIDIEIVQFDNGGTIRMLATRNPAEAMKIANEAKRDGAQTNMGFISSTLKEMKEADCKDPTCMLHGKGGLLEMLGVTRETSEKPNIQAVKPVTTEIEKALKITHEDAKVITAEPSAMKAIYIAQKCGWELCNVQTKASMIQFKKDEVKLNVHWTKKQGKYTIATSLNHPKKGKTQLFRKSLNEKELEDIFRNPRKHTDKGYYSR